MREAPTSKPGSQKRLASTRRDKQRKAQEKVRELILSERANGNIVVWGLMGESLMSIALEEFVKQPAEGMLYDLNRSEEISLSFLSDRKWVNDFAVALTIRKLVEQRDAARTALSEAVSAERGSNEAQDK